jgi:predicted alpha/beta-fold hydrolase
MAPIGILWLLFRDDLLRDGLIRQQRQREGEAARRQRNSKHLIIAGGVETIVPFVTVGMSWIVMTDQMYRYEYGPHNLFFLFGFSWILASRASQRRRSKAMERTLRVMGIAAVLWTTSLPSLRKFQHVGIFDENEPVQIQPGLYYNVNNPLIRRAVERYWPQGKRTYERPTPWMITGDARTGLPYFLNTVRDLDWKRVYLTVHDSRTRERKDEVVLELAVAFPGEGHDASKPLYLVLHGVNGGTTDGYIRDFVTRRNAAGSTVVVMEARGFMGTPLHSDSLFHGGRWSDVHATAKALRKALGRCQVLAGVGYSMGAIILSNYVARSGPACALDAAAAISGALDCRMEQNYTRSQRMWQPMIADHLRSHYYARFLRRLSSRLSPSEMTGFWRATNVVGIDEYASARYNGYADLEHFYADMGAMGDVRLSQLHLPDVCNIIPRPKICTMATPLVVLHSFDDPISTWRTVAANQGIMHPRNLVRAAENLVLLLTEKGGHVGWPVGMVSFQKQWEFMNEVASSFVEAVVRAKLDGGEEVAFRDEMNVKTCNASRLLGDNHCLFGG